MTYLTVSIPAKDEKQLRIALESAKTGGAEAVELRLDFLQKPDADAARSLVGRACDTGLPVIATCRERSEGGSADWSMQTRLNLLTEALAAGADFIDCEFASFKKPDVAQQIRQALSSRPHARLILSAHSLAGPFENPASLYDNIIAACPQAVPKIVYTANHINDCFAAFDLLGCAETPAVIFCMGSAGLITRILAKKFDSFLTFASLDAEQATAPGQLTLSEIKKRFNWDRINLETEVFGLIGDPVVQSLGPDLFNACFAKQNINALYLPLHVQGDRSQFNDFMDNVLKRHRLNFGGFSVTSPHKTCALDYAGRGGDFIENSARNIGAANTLKIGFNSILSAYNTDCAGAIDALTDSLAVGPHGLHNKKVAVLGAGGAARAVVAGLSELGADITIYNRTLTKAQALADEFRAKAAPLDNLSRLDAQIIINCTRLGMHPDIDSSPVSADVFTADMTAFDTVYNPLNTKFLADARAVGARTVCGAEMFIRQALAQYRIFTGFEPDADAARQTIYDLLDGARQVCR